MYEYIKGILQYTCPEYVVLENNGIGYQIFTPNPFVFQKHKEKEITIYLFQYVREDLIALYGFESFEQKLLFKKLLNVSGIGPKGALAILAFGEPIQVIAAIENEDEKFLTKFPGVGKKTARQMILDLKGKLGDVVSLPELEKDTTDIHSSADHTYDESLEEALLALAALGYSDRELKRIKPKLQEKDLTTDEYIKHALQLLIM